MTIALSLVLYFLLAFIPSGVASPLYEAHSALFRKSSKLFNANKDLTCSLYTERWLILFIWLFTKSKQRTQQVQSDLPCYRQKWGWVLGTGRDLLPRRSEISLSHQRMQLEMVTCFHSHSDNSVKNLEPASFTVFTCFLVLGSQHNLNNTWVIEILLTFAFLQNCSLKITWKS